jgi:hypothetical protein
VDVSAWWAGLPAAQATVECGGELHRLRWEAGALGALDHGDVEGERTLAALGGERCACVEFLAAWERHAADEQVLVLARRGPADRIGDDAHGAVFVHASPHGHGPLVGPQDVDLKALLRLGGGLPDRLVATVVAAQAGEPLSPRLHAALYGRVLFALRGWLDLPDFSPEFGVADTPSLSRERVEVPVSWLTDVWARGLTTVLGRFCLAAETDDGRVFTLTTVGPDLGDVERLRLDRT